MLSVVILISVIALIAYKSWGESQSTIRKEKTEVLKNFPVPPDALFESINESGYPDSTPTTIIRYSYQTSRIEVVKFYKELIQKNKDWEVVGIWENEDKIIPVEITIKVPELKNNVSILIHGNVLVREFGLREERNGGQLNIRSSIVWPYE